MKQDIKSPDKAKINSLLLKKYTAIRHASLEICIVLHCLCYTGYGFNNVWHETTTIVSLLPNIFSVHTLSAPLFRKFNHFATFMILLLQKIIVLKLYCTAVLTFWLSFTDYGLMPHFLYWIIYHCWYGSCLFSHSPTKQHLFSESSGQLCKSFYECLCADLCDHVFFAPFSFISM